MSKSKNPFAKAFEKVLQEEPEKAQQLGIEAINQVPIHGRNIEIKSDKQSTRGLKEPPMMYRAQIQGRCNLQFAGDKGKNPDRDQWMMEWLQSSSNREPRYQYGYEGGGDKTQTPIYSFRVKFPYRVFSNSGQDSILRPVLGKYGIPYIPGSSIKGLLKRFCYSDNLSQGLKDHIQAYCGDEEKPGSLRFHGAYPIGNWASQIVDIVHPQQARQVKDNTAASAFALLSFYQPTFIFEISSADKTVNFQEVESLIRQALHFGLGGKTSIGYGFAGIPNFANLEHSDYEKSRHFQLKGEGVSSLLFNGEPEFRPNTFKACLRGHISRLLGGVCDSERDVEQEVDRLLGSTGCEGVIKLFWQYNQNHLAFNTNNRPTTYSIQGNLHITSDSVKDLDFLITVLKFAYTMGGFGKSWRRVWHETFYPAYRKFSIGCHWESESSQLGWVNSQRPLSDQLRSFLQNDIHESCLTHLNLANAKPINSWRESFHKDRVAVYCSKKPVTKSAAINLFHNNVFKTTLSIGGRVPHKKHPQEVKAPSQASHIWHRMLPIGKDSSDKDQYLEIVTLFHGDRQPWQRDGVDQLIPFITELEAKSLKLAWGTDPRNSKASKKPLKKRI